jgi:hypothetical protein
MSIQIHPELQSHIPPLRPSEREQLEASLKAAGRALDAIKVWRATDGTLYVLDGHNRLEICDRLGLSYDIRIIDLPDLEAAKAWMRKYQRGRRNLTPDQELIILLETGDSATLNFSALKRSNAQALMIQAPDLAEKVRAGKLGLQSAWNALQLRRGTPPAKAQAPARKAPKGRMHLVIGDTQVKPGVPTQHLTWIGRYIVDQFANQNLAIVHLGDHWDMPSLSFYDKGKKAMEGRRYVADIEAGNAAMDQLFKPLVDYNEKNKKKWNPDCHFLLGNHEERIQRAVNADATLEGTLGYQHLNASKYCKVHEFLKPIDIDGVIYAHYFYQPKTSKPYGGAIQAKLKNIGHSFTMGHQQGMDYGLVPVGEGRRHGLVLGSTYLHDEEYLGPQSVAYWRGIVVCHQVENGMYDPMFISLDYLCRRYEGVTLKEFLAR